MVEGLDELLKKVNSLPEKEKYEALLEIRNTAAYTLHDLECNKRNTAIKPDSNDVVTAIYNDINNIFSSDEMQYYDIVDYESSLDYISISDYIDFINKLVLEWNKINEKYSTTIMSHYTGHYSDGSIYKYKYVGIHSFDSDKLELVLDARISSWDYPIHLKMKNGELTLISGADRWDKDVYEQAFLDLCHFFLNINDYVKYEFGKYNDSILSINSNFEMRFDGNNFHIISIRNNAKIFSVSLSGRNIEIESRVFVIKELLEVKKNDILNGIYFRTVDFSVIYQEELIEFKKEKIAKKNEPVKEIRKTLFDKLFKR